VYEEINFGEKEAANFFNPFENLDDELFKTVLKHRRFVYGCPCPCELNGSTGRHFKFTGTIICRRIYEIESQQPVIADYVRRIARLPCLSAGKQAEVWLIAPGCSGLFFFYAPKRKSAGWYQKKTAEYLESVFCRLPGVTLEGNDLLINGGKAAGMDLHYNEALCTLQFTAGVTYDASEVNKYASSFDYSKKKYGKLAGFNETGMSRADFDAEIKNFYEALKCL
jgi:hypothetical protein